MRKRVLQCSGLGLALLLHCLTLPSRALACVVGTGSGSFGAATPFSVGNGPESVAVGDFNGDGDLDLAAANNADNTVSILLGTGTGTRCTESALNACLPGGGSFDGAVTFNCGGAAPRQSSRRNCTVRGLVR